MKQRLAAIDGLRGAAMLTVLIQHLFGKPYDWMPWHVMGITLFPVPFLSNGFHSLALFFLLSGFVLYLPYVEGRRSMSKFADGKSYFVRRSMRLLPLLIGSSFLIALGYHLAMGTSLFGDFFTMLYQTILHETDYPLHNSVLWSLRTELWFCVAFPLIAAIGLQKGMRPLLMWAITFALMIKCIGVWITPEIGPKLLRDSALGRVDDFVFGMMLAELFVRTPSYLHRKGQNLIIAALLLIACELVALNRSGHISAYVDPLASLMVSIALFLLVASALHGTPLLQRTLQWAPLRYVGRTSYSIYIWHVPLMILLTPNRSWLHLLLYLLTLIGLSRLSFEVFERPFMKTKKTVAIA